MPGYYLTHQRIRPRLCGDADEAYATARLYLCARCQDQVLICSCCDRANIYCARECAEESGAMRNARPDDVINRVTVVAATMPSERANIARGKKK